MRPCNANWNTNNGIRILIWTLTTIHEEQNILKRLYTYISKIILSYFMFLMLSKIDECKQRAPKILIISSL